eukprot:TRINITY_DN2062_c1_g1_i1.p1 TRINITY_DN2062_c1_g1~~TRINITY_DN2062_c1_g1_i1.p1  ORF type:complete len:431 (+),score=110.55 TRINITY_DN2062_c1_g1_i1:89-1381(+)
MVAQEQPPPPAAGHGAAACLGEGALPPEVQRAMEAVSLFVAGGEASSDALSRLQRWEHSLYTAVKGARKQLLKAQRDSRRESRQKGGRGRRRTPPRGSSCAGAEGAAPSDEASSGSEGSPRGELEEADLPPASRRRLQAWMKEEYRRERQKQYRDKAEQRLRKLVGNLWRLDAATAAPAPAPSWDSASSREAVDARLAALDEAVRARPTQELLHDDVQQVEGIGQALMNCAMVGGQALPPDGPVRETPGVMFQYVLYRGKALTVRLHLFPEMAETYIHNHKASFASMCVLGSYVHTTWGVQEEGKHYCWARSQGGVLGETQVRSGRVVPGHSFTHSTGAVYYIHRDSYHTVGETASAVPGGQTLTLFVKGSDTETRPSTVLCNDPSLPEVQAQTDRAVTGAAKEQVLSQMLALLRMSAVQRVNEQLSALS